MRDGRSAGLMEARCDAQLGSGHAVRCDARDQADPSAR